MSHLNLKNNHHFNEISKLLHNDTTYSDMVFIDPMTGVELSAHSFILRVNCPKFFENLPSGARSHEIKLDDDEMRTMTAFLRYIYTGATGHLLKLENARKIEVLKMIYRNEIVGFDDILELLLNYSTAIDIYKFCKSNHLDELKSKIIDYFGENLMKINFKGNYLESLESDLFGILKVYCATMDYDEFVEFVGRYNIPADDTSEIIYHKLYESDQRRSNRMEFERLAGKQERNVEMSGRPTFYKSRWTESEIRFKVNRRLTITNLSIFKPMQHNIAVEVRLKQTKFRTLVMEQVEVEKSEPNDDEPIQDIRFNKLAIIEPNVEYLIDIEVESCIGDSPRFACHGRESGTIDCPGSEGEVSFEFISLNGMVSKLSFIEL